MWKTVVDEIILDPLVSLVFLGKFSDICGVQQVCIQYRNSLKSASINESAYCGVMYADDISCLLRLQH